MLLGSYLLRESPLNKVLNGALMISLQSTASPIPEPANHMMLHSCCQRAQWACVFFKYILMSFQCLEQINSDYIFKLRSDSVWSSRCRSSEGGAPWSSWLLRLHRRRRGEPPYLLYLPLALGWFWYYSCYICLNKFIRKQFLPGGMTRWTHCNKKPLVNVQTVFYMRCNCFNLSCHYF